MDKILGPFTKGQRFDHKARAIAKGTGEGGSKGNREVKEDDHIWLELRTELALTTSAVLDANEPKKATEEKVSPRTS